MSQTQYTEVMKTSVEEKYRKSQQCHRAAIAVLSLLLLGCVALLAGVLLTDGLGLCEQKYMASVHWPLNPTTENGQRVKRSWRDWDRRSKTLSSTPEHPHVNDCNHGCQPIPDITTTTSCPPGCERQCLPGQAGCMNGLRGPDKPCGPGKVITCDESGPPPPGQPGVPGQPGAPGRLASPPYGPPVTPITPVTPGTILVCREESGIRPTPFPCTETYVIICENT